MELSGRERFEVAVIGGGIVGLATALALLRKTRGPLIVLEAEERLASHQTGHNSGVIHSGVYYKPGSLKAGLTAEGRDTLYRFCEEREVPFERCGKVIVATRPSELPLLDELQRRAVANGLGSVRRWSPGELREREPHAAGLAALHVGETGIVDYTRVADAMASAIRELGGTIVTGAGVTGIALRPSAFVLRTDAGEVECRNLVNCGGLWCDRIAAMCGVRPDIRIVPFRGEYYRLRAERRHLVSHLIYPVPDPALPFLGVHFTRHIDGSVEAGPNAILALARRGYSRRDLNLRDVAELVRFPGFWRLAARHWRSEVGEMCRSLSVRAFARALQTLVPEIRVEDLEHGGAGVRAQAVGTDGRLLDDFCLHEQEGMLHVLNAPSPAATASLAIGRVLAGKAEAVFRT